MATEIFGDTTAGADEFPCNADRALSSLFAIAAAGTVTDITGHFAEATTAGANVRYCIYTDAAGEPGALVGSSATASVPSGGGWITCGASIVIPSAGNYWLGMVTDSFEGAFSHDAGGGGTSMVMANGTFSYDSPPASWPGTDATYDGQANIWGTLETGGGSQDEEGGSTALVDVSASGAGTSIETASGGSVAVAVALASGEGSAAETVAGGSTASVTVSASGSGSASESASGGSTASVSVIATGGGQVGDSQSGGSVASVQVAPAGAGTAAESPSGGAIARVSVFPSGSGTSVEQASGGSVARITVTATGSAVGPNDHQGGSVTRIIVRAFGTGTTKHPLDPTRGRELSAGSGRYLTSGAGRTLRQAA